MREYLAVIVRLNLVDEVSVNANFNPNELFIGLVLLLKEQSVNEYENIVSVPKASGVGVDIVVIS